MNFPKPTRSVTSQAFPEPTEFGKQLAASQIGIASALKGVELSGALRNIVEASKMMSAFSNKIPNALRIMDDASKHNDELIKQLRVPSFADRKRYDLISDELNESIPWRMTDLPPSPSMKTNDLLGDLNDRIDRMAELLAQQIEFENTQVAIMRDLLSAALTGAEAQDVANRDALSIARRNMWIAIFAALVAIAGVVIAL